jgi:flagellum-specific ATP synthase
MTHALKRLAEIVPALASGTGLVRAGGHVRQLSPHSYGVAGLQTRVRLGDHLELKTEHGVQLSEVIRIDRDGIIAKPFDSGASAGIGSIIWHRGTLTLSPHEGWRGRSLNALAEPLDAGGPLPQGLRPMLTDRDPPNPLQRRRIDVPIRTGVRVVDLFAPLCEGQRIGIFAGSGVGKSTLLSMLTRASAYDTVVVGLVGERGREVRAFLDDLRPQDRSRTIAVIATSDQSAALRRLAPLTAMTIAEYFRDLGQNVLLIIDSITRYAHAVREVALAAGEPPVARGYTPSVFSALPRLLERAGPGSGPDGSITGVFSVLVDGDDHNDPVADNIRGTLDGHLVLDRAIAEQGRYPAVNPLKSISRLADVAWTSEQRELVRRLRGLVSAFEETRDLRLMGGYREGVDPTLDHAIALVPKLLEALNQTPRADPSTDAFAEIGRALQP